MDRAVGRGKGWLAALAVPALVCGALSAPANAQTPSYSIVELQGVPQRLNENGQVAGWVYVGSEAHAAIYSGGSWQDLGVPTGDQLSALFDINSAGAAVGYSFASLAGPDNRWQAIWAPAGSSSVLPLSVLAPDSFAYAINDGGAIAGCLNRYDDDFPDPHRAFLYANGAVTDLHALLSSSPLTDFSCARDVNNAGLVVGEFQPTSGAQRGFRYQNGAATLLQNASGYLTEAKAVSSFGRIVGTGRLAGFSSDHALVYDVASGTITSLGLETTGAFNSRPNDLNSQGDVVGTMFLSVGERAFLVSGGQVIDLNDLLPAGSDWVLQEAVSINDRGQIVGRGSLNSAPGETRYFLMDPSLTPAAGIDGLIAQVRALRAGGFLGNGAANSLLAKLVTAERHLSRRCSRLSVLSLESFVRQVDQLIRTGRLSAAKGEPLIDEANRMIAELLAGNTAPPKPAHHSKARGRR